MSVIHGPPGPYGLDGLAARYDLSRLDSLVYDGSFRVQLVSDLSGNSALNAFVSNGATGQYASTPNQSTTAADIDVKVRMTLSSTAATAAVFGQDDGSGRNWFCYYTTTSSGSLQLSWWNGAGTNYNVLSTVPSGLVANTTYWVRWVLDADNGAGGNDVKFYVNPDNGTNTPPTTWTQLGATTTAGAFTTNVRQQSGAIWSGANFNTSTNNLNGIVYYAQFAATIDGSASIRYTPASASKLASSFVSATGETWTINTSGDLGARICGARDLVQMTQSKQPIYLPYGGSKYLWLNGVSGNYASTPDSAALDITGDIDLRVDCAPPDWTPSAAFNWMSKWGGGGAGTSVSWRWAQNTNGTMTLITSSDGSNNTVTATSTSAVPFADFSRGWVRVTMDVDNGAGGNTVTFYTSTNGSSWTQLGSAVVTASTTSIFDAAAVIMIGARDTGNAGNAPSLIYRAQIYNGIAGTLAFDFNPATYTSGTTFLDSSSNAATITIQGGAVVVTQTCIYFDGSNDYMASAPFPLSQPFMRYSAASLVTWTVNGSLLDGGTVDSCVMYQRTGSPGVSILAGGAATAANTALALNTRGIYREAYNGANGGLGVNLGAPITASIGTNAANGITVGAGGAANNPSNITESELIIYSANHDAALQARIAAYLIRKWLIT